MLPAGDRSRAPVPFFLNVLVPMVAPGRSADLSLFNVAGQVGYRGAHKHRKYELQERQIWNILGRSDERLL